MSVWVRNEPQLKVLYPYHRNSGQLTVTESVVLPPKKRRDGMEPAFLPDQIDAHRLLVQVSAGRTTTSFKNNQAIFKQDEEADFVFFVQDGRVQLTSVQDGSETLLGIARPGQFFGEACLHDVPVRMATATAIGDCRITSVTKEAMLSKIRSQPRLARKFIDYLSDHNSWVQKELLCHLLKPAEAA